jgi:EmrB/QacA subfamily drug resistance transporter
VPFSDFISVEIRKVGRMNPYKTPRSGRRQGAVLALVCVALATVVSALASLNVALPDIARSTHATQTQLAWVIDAYSLVFASLLLPAGALGDRYGRRRALLVGLAVFGVGSAIAMTAGGATELIGLRGMLGAGAALVMPATLSTITGTFPAEQRLRAVSVWAGVAGASAVVGLLASGLLLEMWSWRAVFGLNVVLAIVSIAGTLWFVTESADKVAPPIDLGGALIAVVGLGLLVFSFIEAPDAGWASVQTVLGICGGLLGLALFVTWELHQTHPLLDPRHFRQRSLSAGSLSIFVQFFAFFGFTFVLLQYLQGVRGHSPLIAAVSVLPLAATMMPTARLTPRLAKRVGARVVCVSGLLLIAGGLLVISQSTATSSYGLLLAGLIPLGVGMGAAMTPATAAITDALPASQQGVGSALNDLSREVGGALGIAVIGSLLTAGYQSHLSVNGLPAAIAEKARSSFAVGIHLGNPVADHARTAFVSGMHLAMLVGAGAAVLAAVLVAALLKPSTSAEMTRLHSESDRTDLVDRESVLV